MQFQLLLPAHSSQAGLLTTPFLFPVVTHYSFVHFISGSWNNIHHDCIKKSCSSQMKSRQSSMSNMHFAFSREEHPNNSGLGNTQSAIYDFGDDWSRQDIFLGNRWVWDTRQTCGLFQMLLSW